MGLPHMTNGKRQKPFCDRRAAGTVRTDRLRKAIVTAAVSGEGESGRVAVEIASQASRKGVDIVDALIAWFESASK